MSTFTHIPAIRSALKVAQRQSEKFFIPANLRRNHRNPSPNYQEHMKVMLARFAQGFADMGLADSKEWHDCFTDQVSGALGVIRATVVPWLNTLCPLSSARILEIGCGTGSSSVALAEQGAVVTGIDIAPSDIEIAAVRLQDFGLSADIREMNATEIAQHFLPGSFDIIMFFGSLEHMLFEERMTALRQAWGLLKPGQFLCVTGAPNRLWWFDTHTTELPFCEWLPTEVAIPFMRQSPRKSIAVWATTHLGLPGAEIELQRHGRGVSYHDIDIAIGPHPVHSSMQQWLNHNPLYWAKYMMVDRSFSRFLQKRGGIHPAFALPWLNVAIQKQGAT